MSKKKVSMQQIADRINVSKMTVSKAINVPDSVRAPLRDKILSIATEMGYDFTKVKIGAQKKYNFAFLIKKDYISVGGEDFYTQIFCNLSDLCVLGGSSLTMFEVDEEHETASKLPENLNTEKLAGLFMVGQVCKEYLEMLTRLGVPVVAIDFYTSETLCDCILSDNFYMGYTATNYLIQRGHREIGFLTQPTSSSIQDRYYGYIKALTENGIQVNPDYTVSNFDVKTNLHTSVIALPEVLPSAFVCNCDRAAYYFAVTLKEHGYRLPQDISLISFDDSSIALQNEPKLTTFHIDKASFAQSAYATMLERVGNADALYRRVYVPVYLKLRDSVSERC